MLCKFSNEALLIFHQSIQVDEIINFQYPELPQVLRFTEHHLNQLILTLFTLIKTP
jgi:hypothetical protein